MYNIIQGTREVVDVLSIENITVFGIMTAIIILLIYDRQRNESKHEKEKNYLREEIRKAQERLNQEFKQTNTEMRKIAENYHVFTTQVFEKLKAILNSNK